MVALDDVSLSIQPGERLALVGENGAGKSSLMNVLYGLYHPDQGSLDIDGKPVSLKSPKDALSHGIGMVHQHFMLVPSLTVAENVALGAEPKRFFWLDHRRAEEQVKAICDGMGFHLDPRARIDTLSVGARQKVEIVKALARGAKTLILDEPTAVLTPQETDELLGVTERLSSEGRTVILISHRLKEVLRFAQRVAVMRRGKLVAERPAAGTTPADLAELMVGDAAAKNSLRLADECRAEGLAPPIPLPLPASTVLKLNRARAKASNGQWALSDVSLSVKPKEIVGIAGVDGNGQRELAEVLTGLRPLVSGELWLKEAQVFRPTPSLLRKLGVAHIPEDRHRHAMVHPLSVAENLSLGHQRRAPFARGQRIDFAGRLKRCSEAIDTFDVRPKEPHLRMAALSGGNQQKVVVARELSFDPKLLIAVQPTRGLDLAAVAQVHACLQNFAASGGAVLLVSLDLDELLALSDRMYVLFEGKVRAELCRNEFDEQRIGRSMLGAEDAA